MTTSAAANVERHARRLAGKGAHAVVVLGGGTVPTLVAIGNGPHRVVECVDDDLVEIEWRTTAAIRATFDDPQVAGRAVAQWRVAQSVYDPDGIGAAVQHLAQSWDWDRAGFDCDRWVANEIVSAAARVVTLVERREQGDRRGAALARVGLADALLWVMAQHHRLLHVDDSELWMLVTSVMGADWERDLDIALGVERGSADLAALSLYRYALGRADRTLSATQRIAAESALDAAERAT